MAEKQNVNFGDCDTRCSSMLSGFHNEKMKNLNQIKKHYSFKAGQRIPLKIDGRLGFFCINTGYVKLSLRQGASSKAIRICGPGDVVGYGSWLFERTQLTSAISAVTICFFDKDLFLPIQEKSAAVSNEIIKLLCGIISIKDERIAALESGSVKQRVAATLFGLNKKFGKTSSSGSEIGIPLDRKTLAELSGTVVETLARVLTELESEKIIQRKGRSLHILKRAELGEYSII